MSPARFDRRRAAASARRRLAAALLAALTLGGGSGSAAGEAASLVLTDAHVYTLNDAQPWAEAVAIRNGAIVAVGSNASVSAHIGPETEVRRLDGRMVLPGFIDAHDHLLTGPALRMGVSLDGVRDLEEALERIRAHSAAHPAEPIVRGYGWSPALFGEHGPTREALDRAVPDRPAVLFDHDAHTLWMNSAAIERSGLTNRSQTAPELRPYISWNARGEPAGAAFEPPAILSVLAALDWVRWPEMGHEAIERMLLQAPALGITTLYDAGIVLPGRANAVADMFALLHELEQSNGLPVRVSGSVIADAAGDPDAAAAEVLRLQAAYGSDLLSLRAVKVYVDGVTTYSTGSTLDPYLDGTHGLQYFDDPDLAAIVIAAERRALSVHFHVDGDGAARQALDALEHAHRTLGGLRSRHTLCHLTFVDPNDLPRLAELNLTANTTPVWMTNQDGWFEHMQRMLPAEMVQRAFPLRALLRHGTRLTFGSDLPSSPLADLAPLRQIRYAVTRRPIDDPEGGYPPLLPGVLTVAEAIHAYTLAGAYQLGIDHLTGSIEPGKRADLVVLERNLFEEPMPTLHTVPVALTLLEGRVTFEATR